MPLCIHETRTLNSIDTVLTISQDVAANLQKNEIEINVPVVAAIFYTTSMLITFGKSDWSYIDNLLRAKNSAEAGLLLQEIKNFKKEEQLKYFQFNCTLSDNPDTKGLKCYLLVFRLK